VQRMIRITLGLALGFAVAGRAADPEGALALVAVATAIVGLALTVAARFTTISRLSWLDAAMGSTAVAALATALGATDQEALALGGVAGCLALGRWHLCPSVVLTAGGVALLGLTSPAEAAAAPLMAVAVWRPGPSVGQSPEFRWVVLAALIFFGLVALTLLAVGQFTELSDAAGALAIVTFIAGIARAALTVTERLRESNRLALTDDLTGLGNRRFLIERLDAAIARGNSFALLLIDLDGFKELNDTLGHHAGDDVLRQIGPRLARSVRGYDALARLGGDEFALVLEPGEEAAATAAGSRVRTALDRSFEVESISVHVDASVGIALFPVHGGTSNGLLRRADVAMYEAKRRRTGHEVYLRDRDRHSRERLELIGELHAAIEAGQLLLHYQPKLHLESGAVHGVEALVRWNHPTRGLLSPGHFLPLVEQSGLSRALTAFVLDRALAEVGRSEPTLGVAVNLGPADLLDLALPGEVDAALRRHDVVAQRLTLEVSEDIVMTDLARTVGVLSALRELRVSVALDDFGAGRSSLSHLTGLPLGELKIDRSFVQSMAEDPECAAIVRAAVELGQRLGMRVVAEGVTTPEAWDMLWEWRCDEGQGDLLGRPMPIAELQAWLRRRTRDEAPTPPVG
jgi:diguanylate cyclase